MKTDTFKILCPFCNAPYDAKMETDYNVTFNCDTCGPDGDVEVEIFCSNCEKLVYKK